MGEITRTTGKPTAPAVRTEPLNPTKTAHVPAICSKTGEDIAFVVGMVAGKWELLRMERLPADSKGKGGGGSDGQTFPVFGHGDNSAWCPSCHIRIRRGPVVFQCGSCASLQCMGSHYLQDGKLYTVCGKCGNDGAVSEDKKLETVKGTISAAPNVTAGAKSAAAPNAVPKSNAPAPSSAKRLR